jgi:hypothetical protein
MNARHVVQFRLAQRQFFAATRPARFSVPQNQLNLSSRALTRTVPLQLARVIALDATHRQAMSVYRLLVTVNRYDERWR